MLTFANAKINLGLFLTEKRDDGYHNLQTVFYPIQIKDAIELIDADETHCVIKGLDVPGDSNDNLCLQAFRALQRDFQLPHQQIILLKNIPIGAGLGGGSADASFLIKLTNQKFELGLDEAQMESYARKLGADCAFFIKNKPVYAYGKGDVFNDFDIDLSSQYLVLVKPSIHVSTAEAYSNVIVKRPKDDLRNILAQPISVWKDHVFNDFEPSVFAKYPEIEQLKMQLYQSGATFALMSGSGSSVFAIFDHPVKLLELEKQHQVFYGV